MNDHVVAAEGPLIVAGWSPLAVAADGPLIVAGWGLLAVTWRPRCAFW